MRFDTDERDPGCIYVNGAFTPPGQARVPALDHGVLYGDGLFETLRTHGGAPFRLREHLARMEAGLRALEVSGAPSSAELERIVQETLARAGLPDAYVRITVTRGVGTLGLDPAGCQAPTVMVAALPLRPWLEEAYRDGVAAAILWERLAADRPPPTVKSTSFQRNVLARAELNRRKAREGFFLDRDGHVTEGVTSNVFAVFDGELLTPPASVCLPGITRAEVLALAQASSRPAREATLTPDALLRADEVFITSSLMELLPVVSVEGHCIGSGAPGPVFHVLLQQYRGASGGSAR